MCGRFSLTVDEFLILVERFGIKGSTDIEYRPSYNIAPTQPVLIIRNQAGDLRAAYVKWGLIPSWVKDLQQAPRIINARAETVGEKPSFRSAFRRRRCLIPADGFYEWKKEGQKKIPFRFHLPQNQLFAFAGIWEKWQGADGEVIETTSILTTEASGEVAPVHERMPLILKPEQEKMWAAEEAGEKELKQLIAGYNPPRLELYRVSQAVNSPRNNSPQLLEKKDTLF